MAIIQTGGVHRLALTTTDKQIVIMRFSICPLPPTAPLQVDPTEGRMGVGESRLAGKDLAYLTQHTGMGEDQVAGETFHHCQVREHYARFKKSGDPRKAKITMEEFSQIMQVIQIDMDGI
jgi:hypothetical protein